MSTRGLVHIDTFIFDGTNYDVWRIRMLNIFRDMGPNIERIVDMGFSPPKDSKNLSLEDEKNSYLNAQASNVIINSLSGVVVMSVFPARNAHELWTKLQDKYDESKYCGEDCSPSTSGRDELSTFSTSPTCGKPQGNDMVSSDRGCNYDSELIVDNHSSLSHCNALSLDLDTCSIKNDLHASVHNPCISCRNHLSKSHVDILDIPCGHNTNASISSSCCVSNNIEETEYLVGLDKVLNGSSNINSSSSLGSHFCLMARESKVTSLTSIHDEDDIDDIDEDDNDASLLEKGEMVHHALVKNKIACANFLEIMKCFVERKLTIESLEARLDETLSRERGYADKIADLEEALEEEVTKESLEETFTLELSRVKETHDRDLAVAKDLETKNDELRVAHAKLLENFEHLENGSRVIKGELIKLTESHAQLKASYSKELSKLSSPIAIIDDACATNSNSCEASILKENVELRAQLKLLSSNYGKLEENHEKLSSSHEDLLVSHDKLKVAHEAIMTKVTSSEPHVDKSTISTPSAILPCASPSISSTHDIATSCDELLSMPCCSNIDASIPSSSCVVSNHIVEEMNELKAQVTSLKKDLENRHKGMSTLDNILSVQNLPMTRVDLDSTPITRTSPRSTRRAKNNSRIRPRLFASSAKKKGIMLDLAH